MNNSERNCNQFILRGFKVISLYILVSAVFPIIRIPFSILDNECTRNLNLVFENLAVGYLSGLFVYYLTVIQKNREERKRRIFEIRDVFTNLRDVVCDLETEQVIGPFANYEYFTDDVYYMFREKLSKRLNDCFLYKDILNRKELLKIYKIRDKYPIIEAYSNCMQQQERTMQLNTIKEVCQLIDELLNPILIELKKRGESIQSVNKKKKQPNV
ncbi:MAG: hypothetical protein IKO89_08540 [Bacteroidales bacterium]|nr:hypothetical protein [Bacteroidales bacterium]MBR4488589.1 hypothetical protein [Bacteroidales bacterium]